MHRVQRVAARGGSEPTGGYGLTPYTGRLIQDGASDQEAGRSALTFSTTHWSVVLAAGDAQSEVSCKALGELCEIYWYPVFCFLRQKGYDSEQAQDLIEEVAVLCGHGDDDLEALGTLAQPLDNGSQLDRLGTRAEHDEDSLLLRYHGRHGDS